MTPALRSKPGVQFTAIAPGGFRLLAAIDAAARALGRDLTITSACDGAHAGPADPHHRGEAYDVRTHDLPDEATKDALLAAVINGCRDADEPIAAPAPGIPRSLATRRFFGFLEDPGTPAEHAHVQVRKGATYP